MRGLIFFYPALTGSKTPTSKFSEAKKLGGESTARKSPIGEG
ncbi:spermidine/putrescine ABC transporter ATP-binding protein [Bacillus cereus]|uniref:Spermidine/putrescine ABC transporter ATP-binding protein n=1 Tax=Bacillus cereus TaxID=1396 RepID=A0A2B9DGL2_BACCE|nr:spermidine/putrescine ABC transporter ATP-binding protein [Bacillus cereus]